MNEIEQILTNLLGCRRHELYFKKGPLDKAQTQELEEVLKSRAQGIPLQHLLGSAEFMGLKFCINKDVFIPRPETEILIEKILNLIKGIKYANKDLSILDIGTGSGCIAVSLAKFTPRAQIVATDISPRALAVAKKNARVNKLAGRIRFIESDLFKSSDLGTDVYDIIVSNPPYIRQDDLTSLPPEVKHDPKVALNGGPDGMEFYRRIIKGSPKYLRKYGLLAMELGLGQSTRIKQMVKSSKNFNFIETVYDYNNIDRVVILRRN